jgi:hypothetical protein
MSIKAMKQALDALGYVMSHGAQVQIAKDILTQAIEQAEQKTAVSPDLDDPGVTPLYTAPVDGVTISEERVDEIVKQEHARAVKLAQAYERGWNAALAQQEPVAWVGLTDEEVSEVIDDVLEGGGWLDVARALEAAIKEKNT